MTRPIRDPERIALQHFMKACTLSSKKVLEIGCGDGELTRQYAQRACRVIGIDPESAEVKVAASKGRAGKLRKTVFLVGKGEQLPFEAGTFDITLFGLSL